MRISIKNYKTAHAQIGHCSVVSPLKDEEGLKDGLRGAPTVTNSSPFSLRAAVGAPRSRFFITIIGATMIEESKLREYLRKAIFDLVTGPAEDLLFSVHVGGNLINLRLSVDSAQVGTIYDGGPICPTALPPS